LGNRISGQAEDFAMISGHEPLQRVMQRIVKGLGSYV